MPALDVAIIGGGPGGAAAANSILRTSPRLNVKVFERAKRLGRVGFTIAMTGNGLASLEVIDPVCHDKIDSMLLPDGPLVRYTKEGEETARTASTLNAHKDTKVGFLPWFQLQQTLLHNLPDGVLQLGSQLENLTVTPNGVELNLHEQAPVTAKVVIGADGNQSLVRQLCLGDGPPKFNRRAFWRGQAPVPQDWPYINNLSSWFFDGPQAFMHVVRLRDGYLAWTAASRWPQEDLGKLSSRRYVDAAATQQQDYNKLERCLATMGEGWPPALLNLLRATDPSTVTEHGQFYREAADCRVWGRGPITLLGDAAHLGTPILAQGTNQTMEDAVELGRAIGRYGPTEQALREYEAVRLERAQIVQSASVEMSKNMSAGRPISEQSWHEEHPYIITYRPEPLLRPVAA